MGWGKVHPFKEKSIDSKLTVKFKDKRALSFKHKHFLSINFNSSVAHSWSSCLLVLSGEDKTFKSG